MNSQATTIRHADTREQADTSAFSRLGSITRELHEALRSLDAAPELQRVIQEIPDARERLTYVGAMTEGAAHRVLGLVETAKPDCIAQKQQASQLAELLERNAKDDSSNTQHAMRMLTVAGGYARRTAAFAERQEQVLSDIMMAQDFQDLSGQVIKKVVDMITRTERQLVQLLLDYPDEAASCLVASNEPSLQGPQTPDKALQQDDVDDLLASMGF